MHVFMDIIYTICTSVFVASRFIFLVLLLWSFVSPAFIDMSDRSCDVQCGLHRGRHSDVRDKWHFQLLGMLCEHLYSNSSEQLEFR
jgi:hypothetical protein